MAIGKRKRLYTKREEGSFGIWVELGARDPGQQPLLDIGRSSRWERREPSGSPWVFELLKNPIKILRQEGVKGVHAKSRVTTTILHHHRGLEKKIIKISVTIEQSSGDVALELDKEGPDPS
jgi:hypothetical protein